jgi:hypothetical protein
MNAAEVPRVLAVEVEGLAGATIASEPTVDLRPTEVRSVPVRVQVPPGLEPGSHPIVLRFRAVDGAFSVTEKTTFIVPR